MMKTFIAINHNDDDTAAMKKKNAVNNNVDKNKSTNYNGDDDAYQHAMKRQPNRSDADT